MKPDLYTKAVLTVIAIMLILSTSKQYTEPQNSVQAQSSSFAGVQFSGRPDGFDLFDSRSGDVWVYVNGMNVPFLHQKIDKPGGALVQH